MRVRECVRERVCEFKCVCVCMHAVCVCVHAVCVCVKTISIHVCKCLHVSMHMCARQKVMKLSVEK